ncbi:hypothetical protein [Methanoculleus sp.]|uniref:hypothetical protein n=1 Tax=Methanoculleus sp. TaxID=90427 RepID=UPI001BD6C56E|nr:hypothetical protein [Methanoculleus sp.]
MGSLNDFEKEWLATCQQLENMELNQRQAKGWLKQFYSEKTILRVELVEKKDEYWDVTRRLNKAILAALNKAMTNYRSNERLRLKETWGTLSEIIYFLQRIMRII